MNKSETHKVPPTEMLPLPDSTFALPKKNVGKETKKNKGKNCEADEVDEETTTEKKVHVAESKGKKERGKKAAEAAEAREVPAALKVKKVRGKKADQLTGSSLQAGKHEEVVENNHPVEVEAPVADIKEKKGRVKKAQPPAKAEEMNSFHEDIPEREAEEKAVEVTAGPKPKTGSKSKIGLKSRMETKPTEEEDKRPSVAEPEVAEKKGRVKKANPSADSGSQIASEVDSPYEMDGLSSSGGDVASFNDRVRERQKTSSSEKTLVDAFKEIGTMADQLELPEGTVDRAKQLFQAVKDGKHSKGLSTHTVATTCLYIACRQIGDHRTMKEICAVGKITIKEFGLCYKKIMEVLNITLDPITTEDFIPRFCCDLGLLNNIQKAASHIARKAVELDIVPGRCPISVAAVAIYMASHASGNKLTKMKLCEVAGVVDVTIRESYRLMYPRSAALYPDDLRLDLSLLPQPSQNQ